MSDLSGQAIRALGKKLRDGVATSEDLDLLDNYRIGFEPTLLTTAHAVSACLNRDNVRHIYAGRIKRTKSIIRKLRRPQNQGMDLSRMSDIVGIRIILGNIRDQDRALALLVAQVPMVHEPYDYRDRDSGYRAIHLISGSPAHRVEVQLRTCAQHYWAVESERLGERAKEGETNEEEKKFLINLSECTKAIDETRLFPSNSFTEQDRCESEFSRLINLFERVIQQNRDQFDGSYVVVYDSVTNNLIRVDPFSAAQRNQALDYFRTTSRELDETRYDILVLNSGSKLALAVTHPRYFPEAPDDP